MQELCREGNRKRCGSYWIYKIFDYEFWNRK